MNAGELDMPDICGSMGEGKVTSSIPSAGKRADHWVMRISEPVPPLSSFSIQESGTCVLPLALMLALITGEPITRT